MTTLFPVDGATPHLSASQAAERFSLEAAESRVITAQPRSTGGYPHDPTGVNDVMSMESRAMQKSQAEILREQQELLEAGRQKLVERQRSGGDEIDQSTERVAYGQGQRVDLDHRGELSADEPDALRQPVNDINQEELARLRGDHERGAFRGAAQASLDSADRDRHYGAEQAGVDAHLRHDHRPIPEEGRGESSLVGPREPIDPDRIVQEQYDHFSALHRAEANRIDRQPSREGSHVGQGVDSTWPRGSQPHDHTTQHTWPRGGGEASDTHRQPQPPEHREAPDRHPADPSFADRQDRQGLTVWDHRAGEAATTTPSFHGQPVVSPSPAAASGSIQRTDQNLRIGQRVEIKGPKPLFGVLRWVGTVKHERLQGLIMAGVELVSLLVMCIAW